MNRQTYADPDTDSDLPAVPDGLSSAEAKLVYLSLQVTDGCTVEELRRARDVQRLALFPVLDSLRRRGLIDDEDVVDWGST